MKKIVCRHKSQEKKIVENVGRKKKFVVEIDEKYVAILFSRIWHVVVLTQFRNADSKYAPCRALFCLFTTQNLKTKWNQN